MTSKLRYAGIWGQSLAESPTLFRSILQFAARAIRIPTPNAAAKVDQNPKADGAGEEESPVDILGSLDGASLVFHDILSRYGSIDHVVLSAAHGIFLIETKPHSGRVSVVDSKLRVNGKSPEKDFVAQALRNTYWLIEEVRSVTGLEPSVVPLILFTNASVDLLRPLKGIPISDRRSLLATMRREGEPMKPQLWEVREKIAAVLGGTRALV